MVGQLQHQVALVTGASRGLGRAIAQRFAAEGARVIVADLKEQWAQVVSKEIEHGGGEAMAFGADLSSREAVAALIQAAQTRFGRIDIVVNNAGIIRYSGLPEVDLDNLEAHLAVHLLGSFNTTRAAWPHFADQGYGRVVLTTSTGLLGLENNLSYATAKAGLIGLARSAKLAGEKHGIKVNLIAPAAQTRMAGGEAPKGARPEPGQPNMPSEAVAPMVAFLAHENCPVSGEIYVAGADRFSRLFLAATEGYVHAAGSPTIEDVAAHWDEINDETGYTVPADLMAWSGTFLAHQFGQRPAA